MSIKQIYSPVVVGVPPDNAFNGLVKLGDGELRHYGFEGAWFKPSAHIYIYSTDNGLSWTKKEITDSALFTNEDMPPAVQSIYSRDYLRLIRKSTGMVVLRSSSGIDGPYSELHIDTVIRNMVRQPYFMKSKNRILVTSGTNYLLNGREVMQPCVYYSDDDGCTWKASFVPLGPIFITTWPHEKPRWQNYAIEPTIAELNDGRIWMLLRTSMDQLYESWSTDAGVIWSEPSPSRFYSTITMPSFLRLNNGNLLLFFCSTTPLPEVTRADDYTITEEQKNGRWEDVFTNRDVIHAAISKDDGKTWSGFRELYLNPHRNDSDFATRGGNVVSLDKSVHQAQAVELPEGKVLVAFGQHPLVRAMVIFDPRWLDETYRFDNFKQGLSDWSTFKYIKGIKGHCAYNRDPGALLVDHPDKKGAKVLEINHVFNSALVNDVDGAVWNFPASQRGSFLTRIYLRSGGKGGRINLTDRWFNPTDTLSHFYSMYSLEFDGNGNTSIGKILKPGKWNEITFQWENLQTGSCQLSVNGQSVPKMLTLLFPSQNGINYVQFQAATMDSDTSGYLIEKVMARSRGTRLPANMTKK